MTHATGQSLGDKLALAGEWYEQFRSVPVLVRRLKGFVARRALGAYPERLLAGRSVGDKEFCCAHEDTGRQKVGCDKMETLRKRLRRLEKEAEFRRWLDFSRWLNRHRSTKVDLA
jgi:hypothetical protein